MKEEKESDLHIVLNKEIKIKEAAAYIVFSVKTISCNFPEDKIKKEELIKEKSEEIFLCDITDANKNKWNNIEQIISIQEDIFKQELMNKLHKFLN